MTLHNADQGFIVPHFLRMKYDLNSTQKQGYVFRSSYTMSGSSTKIKVSNVSVKLEIYNSTRQVTRFQSLFHILCIYRPS